MITTINEWRKVYENNENEKNAWWDANYQKLISIASNYDYDNWMAYLNDDEDAVGAIMDSTGKHKALTLLSMLDIDDLNQLIQDYEDIDESVTNDWKEILDNLLGEPGPQAKEMWDSLTAAQQDEYLLHYHNWNTDFSQAGQSEIDKEQTLEETRMDLMYLLLSKHESMTNEAMTNEYKKFINTYKKFIKAHDEFKYYMNELRADSSNLRFYTQSNLVKENAEKIVYNLKHGLTYVFNEDIRRDMNYIAGYYNNIIASKNK